MCSVLNDHSVQKSAMSSVEPLCHAKIFPSPLRLTTHTTYYSSFFLLRTPVTINGQPAQVGCSSEGKLTLSCRYPSLILPLHSIRASLEEVVKIHGVSRVGDTHCEEVPLFPVSFSSENSLRKFLINRYPAQQQLESLFPVRLPTHDQQSASDWSTPDQQASPPLICSPLAANSQLVINSPLMASCSCFLSVLMQ